MRYVASFDITSEVSTAEKAEQLSFHHPDGLYEVRLRDGGTTVDSAAGFLRLQIFFDAQSIDATKDIAVEYLIEALNTLCMVTKCKLDLKRLRHIVDVSPGLTMRDCLIYSTKDAPEPVQPALSAELMPSTEALLACRPSARLQGAMRWFRLGVGADAIEEQFQNFWLALELASTNNKPDGKVNDVCQTCGGNLFCEACKTYPMHRPFNKQAIEAMVKRCAPNLQDLFKHLYKARNTLLHGDRLKSIVDELPCPLDRFVNIAGEVTWKAITQELMATAPAELNDKRLNLLAVNHLVRVKIGAAAHIQTVVPYGDDGEPNINRFTPPTVELTSD